jgi:guanylate kinase
MNNQTDQQALSQTDWQAMPGRLLVVSGPSGSGKSTIVREALARPNIRAVLSVSATTRSPRPGEVDGREYFFMSREEFETARDRGEFLEWAEVHGSLYGTPAAAVASRLSKGECVLLEIDVKGAMQVVRAVPSTHTLFINVPSLDLLETRLRARGTEDEEVLARRLANARAELAFADKYEHQIINDHLDRAVEAFVSWMALHGCGG